jgi:peptide/nickel transport system permease protein
VRNSAGPLMSNRDVIAGAELETVPTPRRPGRRHLWIVRRLLVGVVTLVVVSVIVFAATQALPSDPARAILGREATPARVAALREELGLNKPVAEQYFNWLGGVLRGDLGRSLAAGTPVTGSRSPSPSP